MRNLKEMKNWFVIQEDTDLYNVFNTDDFDEDGYYNGHSGDDAYHIDNFEDIVFESDSFEDCERFIDNQLKW